VEKEENWRQDNEKRTISVVKTRAKKKYSRRVVVLDFIQFV
jgi:hypothetical protein